MIGIDLSGRTAIVTGAGGESDGRLHRSLRPPALRLLSMTWMSLLFTRPRVHSSKLG